MQGMPSGTLQGVYRPSIGQPQLAIADRNGAHRLELLSRTQAAATRRYTSLRDALDVVVGYLLVRDVAGPLRRHVADGADLLLRMMLHGNGLARMAA